MSKINHQVVAYESPPITERIVTVTGELDEGTFEENSDTWNDLVVGEFPKNTSIVEWKLNMKESEDGVPMFDKMDPELVFNQA